MPKVIPPYTPAVWRYTICPEPGKIEIAFDLPSGVVLRLRLDMDEAHALRTTLTDALEAWRYPIIECPEQGSNLHDPQWVTRS